MKTKISVIMVVKNGMPLLKQAIQSYKNQTYKNKELLVIYSNSIDQTENCIQNNKKIMSKIIKDYKSKNKFTPLNIGIKHAKGDIVGILHADDLYPDKNVLKKVVNYFNITNADIIYGNALFCSLKDEKKIVRKWKSEIFKKSKLKYGWMPPHTTVYVKKKLLKKNLYPINYPISGDYKFILNLFFKKKLNIKYLNEYLCKMRVGGDSTKISNFLKKFLEDFKITREYFKFSLITVIFKILRKLPQFF